MPYTIPIRDPDKAYRDTWLWVPKKIINTKMLKHSLTVQVGTGELELWRETEHHIGVPRERLSPEEVQCEIVDLTPKEYEKVGIKSLITLDAIKPRLTRQRDAYRDMMEARGGILNLACGLGKTVVILHALAEWRVPALVITHQTHVLYQWKDEILGNEEDGEPPKLELDGEVGWVQGKPETWKWKGCPITLASLTTLAKYADQIPPEMAAYFGVVCWDECFPAGTLVGGVPIEQLKKGSVVAAFNTEAGEIEERRVERLFKKPPHGLVEILIEGSSVVCTPNHPFWTESGWVQATELREGDMVLCCTHEQEHLQMRRARSGEGDRKVLQQVPSCPKEGEGEEDQIKLHIVRESGRGDRKTAIGAVPTIREGLLLREVQDHLGVDRQLKENEANQPLVVKSDIEENEGEQPNAQPPHPGEAENNTKSSGLEARQTGGERKAPTTTSTTSRQLPRVGHGGGCVDGDAVGGATNSLQDRHSQQGTNDRRRSGRPIPPSPKDKEGRQQERRLSSWKRVDRVEVLKPTSDGTFGGRCPDGFVYNIQVEGLHTYTVGPGFVVHNCQHLPATQYSKTAALFPGRRLGATATVNRPDGGELVYLWHVGWVFHSNLEQDLVPEVIFHPSYTELDMDDSEVIKAVTARVGEGDREEHMLMMNAYVGQLPEEIEIAKKLVDEAVREGLDTLVLSTSVDHIVALGELYPDAPVLYNKVAAKKRLRLLKQNKLSFATVQLLKEAANKRSLENLIILVEFSSANTLQQSIGRALRDFPGKQPKVTVVHHLNIPDMRGRGFNLKRHFRKWGMEVKTCE